MLTRFSLRPRSTDIRVQQRNGRKTLTTIQGLPEELDQKRILKAFKKVRCETFIDAKEKKLIKLSLA
jgi:translation initiation factor SUI1